MGLVIIGCVLLVGAAVAVMFALGSKRRWQTMLGTETSTAADLTADLATAREFGGAPMRRTCEVTGAATEGPDGELRSELAGLPCVWYRYEVRRRYWENTTDSDGRSTRSERTETVAQLASSQLFRVTDATGSVLIRPDGTTIDSAEQVVDQFTPNEGGASLTILGVTLRSGGNTIGYHRTEWIVRPGTNLYVLGEADAHGDEVVIGKPATGVHVISTRSEAELRGAAQRTQRILMWSALVLVVVGIALLVTAIVR